MNNVTEAVDTRRKRPKRRNLQIVNEQVEVAYTNSRRFRRHSSDNAGSYSNAFPPIAIF